MPSCALRLAHAAQPRLARRRTRVAGTRSTPSSSARFSRRGATPPPERSWAACKGQVFAAHRPSLGAGRSRGGFGPTLTSRSRSERESYASDKFSSGVKLVPEQEYVAPAPINRVLCWTTVYLPDNAPSVGPDPAAATLRYRWLRHLAIAPTFVAICDRRAMAALVDKRRRNRRIAPRGV